MSIDEWNQWFDNEQYPDPAMIKRILIDWQGDISKRDRNTQKALETIQKLYVTNQILVKTVKVQQRRLAGFVKWTEKCFSYISDTTNMYTGDYFRVIERFKKIGKK